ncbi:DUF4365 domain-containing protein [Chitinophaga horti]|uniref:DUF4365 domain-containing protein n=1 Tax=Chitinophaga horti TaxID=2920382 RepID=A0ABY6IXL8_9BACT|nr:DUF4365 domain-containing protein [Chitinophaga horti]UYQ92135.1 DUF4365 domain-containing protein [Chitinophaga horti]
MAERKKRSFQHIMESESFDIIRQNLPKHWVVREFNNPDYGVDLVIEIFEDSGDNVNFEVLGEYVYVQVKSVQKISIRSEQIYSVNNVSKFSWEELKGAYIEDNLISYALDTNSLYTVEKLGGSISFLLFVVDLAEKNVYFICLNDLIDKYIKPKDLEFLNKKSVTLKIPTYLNFNDKVTSITALKFYGKRAKLLSAFAKFFYQRNEVFRFVNRYGWTVHNAIYQCDESEYSEFVNMIRVFISQVIHLDVWQIREWVPIDMSYRELENLKKVLEDSSSDRQVILSQALITWHKLCNLANLYEEIVREWHLPKLLSYQLSHPNPPTEVSEK